MFSLHIRLALVAAVLAGSALTTSPTAAAMGFAFSIGNYNSMNVARAPWAGGPWEFGLERKPTYGGEVYLFDILDDRTDYRVGLRFFTQTAIARPVHPEEVNEATRKGYAYRLKCYLASYQHRVYHHRAVKALLDVSGGLAARSFEDRSGGSSCEVPFCDLPEVGWVGQAGAYLVYRVTKHFGVQLSGHATFISVEKQNMFPFSSGAHSQISLICELDGFKRAASPR